jgi:CHAT domain-containing protein
MRTTRFATLSVVILFLAVGSAAVFRQAKIKTVGEDTSTPNGSGGNDDLVRLRTECLTFVGQREYSKAQDCFKRGYDIARRRGEIEYSARFLTNSASVDLYSHRLRSAMNGYLAAKALAEVDGNQALVSALSANISWVYSALGAFDEASAAIEVAAQSVPEDARDQYLPKIRMQQANLAIRRGEHQTAMTALQEGLYRADRTGDTEMMCSLLDGVGRELLRRGESDRAEPFVLEAFRLYALTAPPVPDVTYLNLAILHHQQDKLDAATRFINLALETSNKPAHTLPSWTIYYHRAQIRRASGDLDGALADLEAAVAHAQTLRLDLLPAESVRVAAGVGLRALYEDYVDSSRLMYEQSSNPTFVLRSFEVAERSRAAGLRETLNEAESLREILPLEYWEILGALIELEQDHAHGSDSGEKIRNARHRLTEIEIEAGLTAGAVHGGLAPVSVDRIQKALDSDRALLAFHLGDRMSHLWAVTSSGIEMHRLPPRKRIENAVAAFRNAVEVSAPQSQPLGEFLYRTLFGELSAGVRERIRWDILPDGVLFESPFAALVAATDASEFSYLVELHSLRILPGAGMLLEEKGERWNGPLTIVADPLYNAADPRFNQDSPPEAEFQLSRLVGTGREAMHCAQAYGASFDPVILDGSAASILSVSQSFLHEPAILHFATHVVPLREDSTNGFIALSLGADGRMEMLGPTAVSAMNVHPALVVMSGCSSGAGKVLPGEGLFGLTRAWLQAGAHNVAATLWPTPDQSGELLQAFYRNLSPDGSEINRSPYEALQLAQVEMIRSGDWRSKSEHWASLFLVGKN